MGTLAENSTGGEMAPRTTAIVIHEKDNVATALRLLHRDEVISVEIQNHFEKIKLISEIPMGHKFALNNIEKGAPVVKYGEPIGEATSAITKGEHVHVHNMMSPKKGSV
jgi:altronate dehydratase small subunit